MLQLRFQHSDSTERRPVRGRYVGMAEYAGYVLRNQCAFGFQSCMFWRCATLSTSWRAFALQSLARKSRSESKAEK